MEKKIDFGRFKKRKKANYTKSLVIIVLLLIFLFLYSNSYEWLVRFFSK
jgi:uncharacterized integral membrane protein